MTFCLGIGYVAISIFPDRRSSLGRRPVTHLLPGMITWRHINVTLDDLAFALRLHPDFLATARRILHTVEADHSVRAIGLVMPVRLAVESEYRAGQHPSLFGLDHLCQARVIKAVVIDREVLVDRRALTKRASNDDVWRVLGDPGDSELSGHTNVQYCHLSVLRQVDDHVVTGNGDEVSA